MSSSAPTRTPTRTHIHACVERMEEIWVCFASDYLGCYTDTSDTTPDAALAALPQAVAEWHTWAGVTLPAGVALAQLPVLLLEQIDRWYHTPLDRSTYEVNAFYAADRPALTAAEVDLTLRLLETTRANLLASIAGLDDAALAYTHPGEWSILQTLLHLGGAERWYQSHLDLIFPQDELPAAPRERLEVVRANLRTVLPTLVGDDRFTSRNAEIWTARKIVRRAVWHEQDHTQHIQRLRTLLPPHLAIGG